jgi:Zn-dependent M28 family amino/carboxypeptidase
MNLQNAQEAASLPLKPGTVAALETVTESGVEATVRALSFSRDFLSEPEANRRAGDYVAERLQAFGYTVTVQGEHRNIVALPKNAAGRPLTLIGAHYDSVPGTPGADDNASAVASLIACAEAVARLETEPAVGFVAFNREEEQADRGGLGLVGSTDFAESYLPVSGLDVRAVHVLEMIGYRDMSPSSQRTPPGLPISLPDTGDFLGIIGNAASAALVETALGAARTYVPELPVLGLTLPPGAEQFLPVLRRSDHAPFWRAGIPALQWTDTAEFRNPYYHGPADTPETLDYAFFGICDPCRARVRAWLTESGSRFGKSLTSLMLNRVFLCYNAVINRLIRHYSG